MIHGETDIPDDNESSSTIEWNRVLCHACPLQAWVLLEGLWPEEADAESRTPEKLVCVVVLVKILANATRVSQTTNRFYQLYSIAKDGESVRTKRWVFFMLCLSLFCLIVLFENARLGRFSRFLA